MSKSREQLDNWLKKCNYKAINVLDIGPQDKPAKDRLNIEFDIYHTVDIDPQWNPDYVSDLSIENPLPTANYDLVFALEVFEHVIDLPQMLRNIRKSMPKGGTLIFSCPTINPVHDVIDIARYMPEGMEAILQQTGFTDIEISRRRATVGLHDLLSFYKKEGLRISKIRQKDAHLIDTIGIMGKAKA